MKLHCRLCVIRAILTPLMVVLVIAGCNADPPSQYHYQPPARLDDGLEVGTLDDVGLDSVLLGEAVEGIENGRFGEVHSMLIFKDNRLVLEEYFPGHDYQWDDPDFHGEWVNWTRDKDHNIHSVGKSITSACVGIAIEEGFIASVEQSIFDFLPDYQHLQTDGKHLITIEHLLTMTAGLAWDEWGTSYANEGNDVIALWLSCQDPIACILEKPLVSEPGTTFTCSGGNMVLLGEIIRNATGMDIEAFAAAYLFQPLGIEPVKWVWINDEVIYAGGDQRMTPREMLKLGVLYLNEGMWTGRQIVSWQWVEKSAIPYSGPGNRWLNNALRPVPPDDGTRGRRGYAYTWWTHEFTHGGETIPAYWASGFGDQRIVIFPEQDAVVAFTSGNYNMPSASAKIVSDFIVPAFE